MNLPCGASRFLINLEFLTINKSEGVGNKNIPPGIPDAIRDLRKSVCDFPDASTEDKARDQL